MPHAQGGEQGDAGDYAATGISSTSRSMSGYQRLKMTPSSPSSVFTRLCNNNALIGFRGLMLQAWSKQHNSFLRPLKKKGFKEERVTTMGWYDLGTSHDPGIQQEPQRHW